MASDTPLLEVDRLVVRYGKFTAVFGLSFDAYAGQVVLVLGANGAGKSSTLRAITGLVPAAAGTIKLSDEDITRRSAWRNVGSGLALVPEGRQIFTGLTVHENLLLGAYSNTDATHRRTTLAEVYELFPVLADRRQSVGGLLSGGEQQMLAFGRALMSRPTVVLLDEPTMGLAPVVVDTIFETVRQVTSLGIAVVMVEQNVGALELADTIHVLEQGHIALSGSGAELRDDPQVVAAYLGVEDSVTN
ncbi:MAG: ABC transporter ATP-binding protein [Actinomycetia bacterium]|nr:ABC transporter ATP-binding protein [Actinomycetes bacterium]